MTFYERNKFKIIISGYIRQNIGKDILNDIRDVIYVFSDKYLRFNVHNSSSGDISCDDECICVAINGDEVLFVNDQHILRTGCIDNVDNFKNYVIKNISSGIDNHHGFIYTDKCELYGYGDNRNEELGFESENFKVNNAMLINANCDGYIKDIKCGNDYSLFLNNKGNVFGCGSNDYNQLTSNYKEQHKGIQSIITGQNIAQINCCSQTSLILTNEKVLKIFGLNIQQNRGIYNGIIPLNDDVIYFDCGVEFAGYITKDYELIMFGDNSEEQCGLSDANNIQRYTLTSNEQIIKVKCGGWHSFVKTKYNKWYSFGYNAGNQLLLKKNDRNCVPTLISIKYIQKNIIKSKSNIIDFIPAQLSTYIITQAKKKTIKPCCFHSRGNKENLK